MAYAPDEILAAGREPVERMLDLETSHPGQSAQPTVPGGFSVLHRGTLRWKGLLQIGPYQAAEDAEAVEAMLTELSFGDRWCLFPLHRTTWTPGADIYVFRAATGTNGGTALWVDGQRDDMRKGQFFTVGDPADADTVHPRRIRRIVATPVQGPPNHTLIQQEPALPQTQTGDANPAALVQPATHVAARLTTPGSVVMPLNAGAPGRYGPWLIEWTEHVFTGGG